MKLMRLLTVALTGALMTFTAQSALAAGKVTMSVQVMQEKTVKDPGGKVTTKLVPAGKIVPGTVVAYLIHYTNTGQQTATNVVIRDPVPKHMNYIAGSAEGKGTRIRFSVDNGNKWAATVGDLTVEEHGQSRPATAADVTTIRWTLDHGLAPGAGGEVRFSARLQ